MPGMRRRVPRFGKKSENFSFFLLTFPQNRAILIKLLMSSAEQNLEVWLSLVERFVRDEEAAGSNPVTSTTEKDRKHVLNMCFWSFFFVF